MSGPLAGSLVDLGDSNKQTFLKNMFESVTPCFLSMLKEKISDISIKIFVNNMQQLGVKSTTLF